MKIAYISTYPNRECGIGTFTNSLLNAMNDPDSDMESFVVAINDHNISYSYPAEVKMTIEQEQQADYLEAANYINLSGADICMLEHEFGIFGGHSGVYILPLLYRLNIPLVVTLHTVLETPSYNEKAILKSVCKMAIRIVVMSKKGKTLLTDVYDVDSGKIAVIEHGFPLFNMTGFNQEKILN